MKNVFKIIAAVIWVVLVAQSASARMLSATGEETSVVEQATAKANAGWATLKAKASSWWQTVKTEYAAPAAPARAPASAPAAAQEDATFNTHVKSNVEQLPTYKVEDKGTKPEQMKAIAVQVQAAPITNVVTPARPAMANLPKSASGVPVFSLSAKKEKIDKVTGKKTEINISVTEIPRLDIGDEERIQKSDWTIAALDFKKAAYQAPKTLASPEKISAADMQTLMGLPYDKAKETQKLSLPYLSDDRKVTLEKVQAVKPVMGQETEIKLAELIQIDEEELKFLRAMILYAQKDKCHVTAGIFHELSQSTRADIRTASEFYVGVCLHRMGLFSESIDRLIRVIATENAEYAPDAIETLVSQVPIDFEIKVAEALDAIKNTSLIPEKKRGDVDYQVAKGFARKQKYEQAFARAEKIAAGHKRYVQAQFIAGVAEYGMDRYKESLDRYTRLKEFIDKNGGDKDVLAMVTLNLARVSFQNKQYEVSVKQFREIRKDHPLWIQALMELGWAQLMLGDPAGAIGNMHSIQSPYFQMVYKPESFVIRTVGYLDICQFGDAYRTLSHLEHDYRPHQEKIHNYLASHKTPDDYHAVLVKYLGSKSSKGEMDGLPASVIRELGRQRNYLNIQTAINGRIDERDQYTFVDGLIRKEKEKATVQLNRSKTRVAQLDRQIKLGNKGDPEIQKQAAKLRADFNYESDLVDFYSFQLSVFDEGQKSMAKLAVRAKADLEKHRKVLVTKAGEALRSRLTEVEKELVKIMDNNEFLRYEVFAGSGENLRFEMAGGKTAADQKRVPASVRPKSQDLNWNFDGEFWEDEIGNYRSSLKNNCQSSNRENRS